jgi:hypothetical protein
MVLQEERVMQFLSRASLDVSGCILAPRWQRASSSPSFYCAVRSRFAQVIRSLMAVLVLAGLYVAPAAAKTAVTSNITTNTTWTLAGSPYDLVGRVASLWNRALR